MRGGVECRRVPMWQGQSTSHSAKDLRSTLTIDTSGAVLRAGALGSLRPAARLQSTAATAHTSPTGTPPNPGQRLRAFDPLLGASMPGGVDRALLRAAGGSGTFLLYLNKDTWVGEAGERLAAEVALACKAGVPLLSVHENDPGKGGCEFATFLSTVRRSQHPRGPSHSCGA